MDLKIVVEQYIDSPSDDIFTLISELVQPEITQIQKEFFKIDGYDRDDITTECLLGLVSAFKSYRKSKATSTSIRKFLKICMRQRIINLIRKSKAIKSKILNDRESIDYRDSDDEQIEYAIAEKDTSIYGLKEDLIFELSILEQKVFELYLQSYTYREISEKLSISERCIDNAIQRISFKAKAISSKKKIE